MHFFKNKQCIKKNWQKLICTSALWVSCSDRPSLWAGQARNHTNEVFLSRKPKIHFDWLPSMPMLWGFFLLWFFFHEHLTSTVLEHLKPALALTHTHVLVTSWFSQSNESLNLEELSDRVFFVLHHLYRLRILVVLPSCYGRVQVDLQWLIQLEITNEDF